MGISPKKWDRVKELYEAALELAPSDRAAFLDQSEDDPVVCAEVQRLLAEHNKLGSFLSTPAFVDPAVPALRLERRFVPGEVLAERFRVVSFISAGGMGEVYEAEDLLLKENVAIKTIRREVLQQDNALARFKREVQLARKVTHPNICRVFDLFWDKTAYGETEATIVFVSMELLKGETLSERIRRAGRFSANEALPVINQIVGGLEAAHRVGVVHRDLKPGNVILVSDTEHHEVRAVITDFGLALRGGRDANETVDITASHVLFGTPAYMAPEQIEGKEATKLADVYALGLMIYEMVTGVHPFPAETPLASAAKRLSDPIMPAKRLAPELSDEWEQAINRCLRRNPADRYSSAADVVKALSDQTGDSSTASQLRPVSRYRNDVSSRFQLLKKHRSFIARSLQLTGVVIVIAAVIPGYRIWYKQRRSPKENLILKQLTASAADNFVEYALISPDGKYLVYDQKAGALFLSSIETRETRVLVPAAGDVFPQSWFPGGSHLLVTKWDKHSLWKLSVLTGNLTKLIDWVRRAFVSPDGTHVLYGDWAGHEVWMMKPDGQEARRIMVVEPPDFVWTIAWSPNGQRFAYILTRHRPDGKEQTLIESRDLAGGQHSEIVSNRHIVTTYSAPLLWLPDGRIIYSLSELPPNQEDSNLWAIGVNPVTGEGRGDPQRLTNWAGFDTTFVSATANGKQLVFMKTHSQRGIFISPVAPNQKSRLDRVDRLTTDTWGSRVDDWTPDSRAVYISTNKGGRFGIYRQDVRQQVSEPVITGPEDYYDARLSADGSSLLYTASANPEMPELGRLMNVPIDGGSPSLLAKGSFEYQCALPPSEACVLSKRENEQRDFYWLDPKVGPAAQPFKTTGKLISWSLSPDGGRIALVEAAKPSRVQILSMNRGASPQLDLDIWSQSQSQVQYMSWFPSGKGLYVTAFLPSGTTLLAVTLAGDITTLFQQGHNWVCCPRISPNSRVLAFSVSEIQRDVGMIENF